MLYREFHLWEKPFLHTRKITFTLHVFEFANQLLACHSLIPMVISLWSSCFPFLRQESLPAKLQNSVSVFLRVYLSSSASRNLVTSSSVNNRNLSQGDDFSSLFEAIWSILDKGAAYSNQDWEWGTRCRSFMDQNRDFYLSRFVFSERKKSSEKYEPTKNSRDSLLRYIAT